MAFRYWTIFFVAGLSFLTACGGDTKPDEETEEMPTAPADVVATADEGAITVTWKDNSDNETGFVIYRDTAAPNLQTQALTQIAEVGVNVQTYTDTTVAEGESYTYGVAAKGAGGTTKPAEQMGEPVSPEPGPNPNPDPTPDPTPNPEPASAIAGTIQSWDTANGTYAFFTSASAAFGEFTSPVFSGPVGANGAFSVELGGVAADDLETISLCGDEVSFSGVLVFADLTTSSVTATPADVTGAIVLASRPEVFDALGGTEPPQPGDKYIAWIYTIEDLDYQGSCTQPEEGGEVAYDLVFKAGWNVVINTITQVSETGAVSGSTNTGPIPTDLNWYYTKLGFPGEEDPYGTNGFFR